MSRRHAEQLSEKARGVYEEVVGTDSGESVLAALQRAEELATKSQSVDEVREALSIVSTTRRAR